MKKKLKTNIKKCQRWALQTTLTVNDQETARRQPFARRCTSCTSYWALCIAFCMPCMCAALPCIFVFYVLYICAAYYILVLHIMHIFLAVHSVFHLQRMFCAEYHKHLETTHFRYKSPMGKSKILFLLALSRILLAWYCLYKPLVDLFYFAHLTGVRGRGRSWRGALYNCESTIHKVPTAANMFNLQSPKEMMWMSRGVFVEDNFKNVMTIGGGNLVCCKKMHKVAVRLLRPCWLIQGSRCFISPMIR